MAHAPPLFYAGFRTPPRNLGVHHSKVFPAGLTSIGNWAFQKCFSLAQLTLPAALTTIGVGAFSDCCALGQGGGEPTLPTALTVIGNGAFQNCARSTAQAYDAAPPRCLTQP